MELEFLVCASVRVNDGKCDGHIIASYIYYYSPTKCCIAIAYISKHTHCECHLLLMFFQCTSIDTKIQTEKRKKNTNRLNGLADALMKPHAHAYFLMHITCETIQTEQQFHCKCKIDSIKIEMNAKCFHSQFNWFGFGCECIYWLATR